MSDKVLIDSWHSWIVSYLNNPSYRAYLGTFQFRMMTGSDDTIMQRMHSDMDIFYGRLLTRSAGTKSKRRNHPPIVFWAYDLPVKKNDKSTVSSWLLNNGLHIHAIICMPHNGDFNGLLKVHMERNVNSYLSHMPYLNTIDIQSIIETPEKSSKYFLKSVYRNRFGHEEIFVLPYSRNEATKREYLSAHKLQKNSYR